MLWLAKRVIFGEAKNSEIKKMKDLNLIESSILIVLASATIFFGFYPQILIDTMKISIENLINNYQIDLIYHIKS